MADREEEVAAIQDAHRAAQARLGVAGAYLAMYDWGSVSALQASETGSSWVARSLIMIHAIRRKSRRLAASYVRLVRALETGYTLQYPEYSDDPDTLTMGVLREQFRDVLLEIADITTTPSNAQNSDEQWFESELRRVDEEATPRPDRIVMADTNIDEEIQTWLDNAGDDDDELIYDEPFDWNQDMSPEDIEEAFQKALENDVVKAAADKAKQVRRRYKDEPATTALSRLEDSHNAAGSIGGGRVDRYGITAGRELLDHVIRKDKRVKVYGRGTRPGCCAFCAMLAANGWYYTSAAGAMGTRNQKSRNGNDMSGAEWEGGFRKYHDNCKCYPIVRFIDNPELPPANAYFQSMWGTVRDTYTYKDKGGGSNPALNAWRSWLNRQRRTGATNY